MDDICRGWATKVRESAPASFSQEAIPHPPPVSSPCRRPSRAPQQTHPPPHPARKATTGLHQSTRAPPCHGCCPVPKAADPGCPGPDLATLVSDLPPCRGQVAAILFTPSPSNPRSSCHRGRCYHCSWERCFPSVASLSPLLAPSPSSAAPPPPRAAPPPLQPRHFLSRPCTSPPLGPSSPPQ